jgi:hypothetical protein
LPQGRRRPLDAALLAALAFFAPFPTPWGKDHSLFGWKHRGAPAARLPVCRYSRYVPGLPFYSVIKLRLRKNYVLTRLFIFRRKVNGQLKIFF